MNTDLSEIHFHDCVLLKIVENTHDDSLEFHVEYPVDWDNDKYEIRLILFKDVLNYSVQEIPIHGQPTLLDCSVTETKDERRLIKIESNAGSRSFYFKVVELIVPSS